MVVTKNFVREGLTQLLLLGCTDFLQLPYIKAIMSWFRSLVDRCSGCPHWVSLVQITA